MALFQASALTKTPTLQLEEDVRDECSEYGTVEGVCIPVPPKTLPPSEPGRAYIMFASHEEAIKAKPVFDGRLFDSVKITAKLVPDDDFQRAAAGEWIHIPLPGGLPAHPGTPLPAMYVSSDVCQHNMLRLRVFHIACTCASICYELLRLMPYPV